jgi:hypothetical protein
MADAPSAAEAAPHAAVEVKAEEPAAAPAAAEPWRRNVYGGAFGAWAFMILVLSLASNAKIKNGEASSSGGYFIYSDGTEICPDDKVPESTDGFGGELAALILSMVAMAAAKHLSKADFSLCCKDRTMAGVSVGLVLQGLASALWIADLEAMTGASYCCINVFKNASTSSSSYYGAAALKAEIDSTDDCDAISFGLGTAAGIFSFLAQLLQVPAVLAALQVVEAAKEAPAVTMNPLAAPAAVEAPGAAVEAPAVTEAKQ